ncbi:MAG: hypothetical protein EOP84_37115 [Verrucomicrobiaceae bacterium]|nr:MAG: hypothetical protein EOP84_37115 [Verrucomicrobiaceae bacterium]
MRQTIEQQQLRAVLDEFDGCGVQQPGDLLEMQLGLRRLAFPLDGLHCAIHLEGAKLVALPGSVVQ